MSDPTLVDLAALGCPSSPSLEGVEEFKKLYFQRYGIQLEEQEALEAATRLLHLLFFGMTPLPGENGRSDSVVGACKAR